MEIDDNTEYVDGYDCSDLRHEPRPDSVVYQPLFQTLTNKCVEAVQLLMRPLSESEYQNITMKGLMAEGQALFCDLDNFETEEKAQKHLDRIGSGDYEGVLEKLVGYAQDVIAEHLRDQEYVSVDGSTAEELIFKLQPYTYSLSGEEGQSSSSPWPLVSVIDFGLENPLLNEGVMIIDSPGSNDTHSTRAKNALDYQLKCPYKITVAHINRAKDDSRLRDSLAQGYLTRGSGNFILVLTHGDHIDEDTEVSGSGLEKKKEMTLWIEIQTLKGDKKKLKQKRQKLSRAEKVDTEDELQELSAKLETKTAEYEGLRMDIRDHKVVQVIQKQYKDLTGDPKPSAAFVVGNDAYKRHVAGYSIDEAPAMTVKKTNIPALRHRIFEIPAEGKLNDAIHLATTQLPSLVHTFELYCSKAHMARKTEIEAIINIQKEKTHEEISKIMGKLGDLSIQKHFKNLMKNLVPLRTELQQGVEDLFDDTRRLIRADPQFNLMALEVFLKSELGKPNAINRILREFKDMHRAMWAIFEGMISPEGGSFMSRAMSPVYEDACKIRGHGGPQKRIEFIKKRICTINGVWAKVHDRVDSAFAKLISERLALLSKALEEVFDSIYNKFNALCEDTGAQDEADKQREETVRQKLHKNVVLARELVDGRFYKLAMQCKNYSAVKEDTKPFVPKG